MKNKLINILILLSLTLSACSTNPASETITEDAALPASDAPSASAGDDAVAEEVEETEIARPANWREETHSNDVDPNYDVVFPEDEVNQITITISPENWAEMQANMVELFGDSGTNDQRGDGFAAGGQPAVGEGGQPPAHDDGGQPGMGGRPEGDMQPPTNGERPEMAQGDVAGGGAGMMNVDLTSKKPDWFEATIEFEGDIWTNVGVRYKGNSSLTSGWRSGTEKLPFKLDFDEFEDDYPEIDDQRFYGFKQLSLSNAFNDTSFMRDAAVSDILEDAELPVAKTAFYEVIIDYGEGPVSLGLYIAVEVIDDTAVERYFGDDEGNIYEGDGTAASFAASTYDQIETSFQKENNEDGDWSDIEELFNVLHADLRTSDPAAWRTALESVFDTDAFLEWLAVSSSIQNWDSYGSMSHNYYLYNDEGQLTWIAWDHNEAMTSGRGGGTRGGGNTTTLDQASVNENWPLIRYLLDDPVYYELYTNYLAETIAGPFNADKMAATYQEMAALISPYASAEVGEAAFNNAVQELIEHAYERANVVNTFLSK